MKYSTQDHKKIFSLMIQLFVMLISGADPEIQVVVIQILSLFVIKYPQALSLEIRIFFCKYNDYSYVKSENLDLILTLSTVKNISLISELSECCNSVDVAFVRKIVKCLGYIAIRIHERAAK